MFAVLLEIDGIYVIFIVIFWNTGSKKVREIAGNRKVKFMVIINVW